ncbi:MAG: MauE/DoxX family redox-associated membrane protein, partial [Gaiellales bacterium]
MTDTTVRVLASLLAATFAWAAVAKVISAGEWRAALNGYQMPLQVRGAAAIGVPILEAIVAVVLLTAPVRIGAALALALLTVFSLALVRASMLRGPRVPCGCFGRSKEREVTAMLARNALIGCVAVVVLSVGDRLRLIGGLSAPGASDLVPLGLTLLGL